jgi:hypothetical protein
MRSSRSAASSIAGRQYSVSSSPYEARLTWITADLLRTCHSSYVLNQFLAAIVARHTIINRWYVSVQAPSDWRPTTSRAPFPRKTTAFLTEGEAKQFAKTMLAAGMNVTAGTLSPHKPIRRTITVAEINRWIEEE